MVRGCWIKRDRLVVYINRIKRQYRSLGRFGACYSALLCTMVFAGSYFLGSSPAFAGFEWTPSGQSTSNVPVVSPKRHVVVPGMGEAAQPDSSMPSLGGEPNKKLHTLRMGSPTPVSNMPPVGGSPIRMIQRTSAHPPASPSLSIPAPVSARISHSFPTSSFTPAPEDHAVYSSSANQRRKTNASAPPPLVLDNMRDLSRANNSYSSYSPVSVPRAAASTSLRSPQDRPSAFRRMAIKLKEKLMGTDDHSAPRSESGFSSVSFPPAPAVVQASGRGLVIDPYPMRGKVASVSSLQSQPQLQPFAQGRVVAPLPVPSQYDVVPGFGSDIPMIMALQQIVPARYTYSFAAGVNPGQRVSWQGNRPWDVVLAEMIQPLGLRANIHGQSVSIR